MKLNRKALLVMTALSAALLMSGCGQTKIGYFDSERVAKEAPQIVSLQDEGKQKLQEAQQEVMTQIDGADSEENAQKVVQEGQRKMESIQRNYANQMTTKLQSTLAEIAKEKELDAVMENANIQKSVVQGGIDVTDEVINKLQ